MPEHLVVIPESLGQAQRQRIDARRLRRQVQSRSVRASYDHSQLQQGGIGEFVFLEKGVEAVQVTVVGHFHAGYVIGDITWYSLPTG